MTDHRWTVEADTATLLKKRPDDAVLALRLGMAVSALQASLRLTLSATDNGDPADERDRLWGFMLATAYLHEARITIQHRFPRVSQLATLGGAPAELAQQVGAITSGKSEVGEMLDTIRKTLVFHFEERAVKEWVAAYRRDTLRWADGIAGDTNKVAYQASLSIVAAPLLAGDNLSTENGRQRLRARLDEVVRLGEIITAFCQHAIAGYIDSLDVGLVEKA